MANPDGCTCSYHDSEEMTRHAPLCALANAWPGPNINMTALVSQARGLSPSFVDLPTPAAPRLSAMIEDFRKKNDIAALDEFLKMSRTTPPELMGPADAVMNDVFKTHDWDLLVEHNLMGLCVRIGAKHVGPRTTPDASPEAYAKAARLSVPASYKLVQMADYVEAVMPDGRAVIVKHRTSAAGAVLPHSSLG